MGDFKWFFQTTVDNYMGSVYSYPSSIPPSLHGNVIDGFTSRTLSWNIGGGTKGNLLSVLEVLSGNNDRFAYKIEKLE